MFNGYYKGERTGSGTIAWKARQMPAAGEINAKQFIDLVASSAPSTGFCNTTGTASTMNSLAETLGMQLPGAAAIPAPYRDRQEISYHTGLRTVEMVKEDLRPSDILTRNNFLNAIAVNSAIGGSTNAPIHISAIARHMGVELNIAEWQSHGYDIPLLLNMQPASEYLGEDFYRAGGVPALISELIKNDRIFVDAPTVNGKTIGENCAAKKIENEDVIRPYSSPLKSRAGFLVLSGNLFDNTIMKTSVISKEFQERYLSNPHDLNALEGKAVVFDGPEDYHKRIDDVSLVIDQNSILFMRGAGPIGYPRAAEVVNMRPPDYLIKQGISDLVCIGDGRQSGTSDSPSILNASPEAAAGGGLSIVKTGDPIRVDLNKGEVNILISDKELSARYVELAKAGGFKYPEHQTPWQEIQRALIDQLGNGAVLKPAIKYQCIAQSKPLPRDNH